MAIGAIVAVAGLAVACSDDDDDGDSGSGDTPSATATTASSSGSPAADGVEGTVSIEGSSTVQPFTLELIPLFEDAYPDVQVNPPSGIGSGGGITAFINQEVDIAQASRTIKQDEIDQAKAAGLDPYETRILNDALAIVVNPDNSLTELTEEQVAQIFAGEITDWSEVGGSGGEITVYTRNEESGTFAYMEEDVIQAILGDDAGYTDEANKQASAPAGLQAVANDPGGIFYAGLGNLAEIPEGTVKVILVAGESGTAVEPSAATVDDGTYPISRGLFYYTDGDPMSSDNAAVQAFVEFALAADGQAVGEELGFLPVK